MSESTRQAAPEAAPDEVTAHPVRAASGDDIPHHGERDRRVHEPVGQHPQHGKDQVSEDELHDPAKDPADQRA